MNAIVLVFTALSGPNSPSGQPIIIQSPPDHLQTIVLAAQTIVLLAQTVVLILIAVWTFRSGLRQRGLERRAAWYHKAVVDHVLPVLARFFCQQNESLAKAAARCVELRGAADGSPLQVLVKATIADFKVQLYAVQAEVSDRTAVFDSKLRDSTSELLDRFEESVSEWFDIHAFSQSRQNQMTLRELLSTFETMLIKLLYDFEFAYFK